MSMERHAFLLGASTLAAGATASASPTPGETSSPVAADDGGSLLLPEGGESRFARVNGVKLHYVRVGVGPNVVLLHG